MARCKFTPQNRHRITGPCVPAPPHPADLDIDIDQDGLEAIAALDDDDFEEPAPIARAHSANGTPP
jgi:hypothetical protein